MTRNMPRKENIEEFMKSGPFRLVPDNLDECAFENTPFDCDCCGGSGKKGYTIKDRNGKDCRVGNDCFSEYIMPRLR